MNWGELIYFIFICSILVFNVVLAIVEIVKHKKEIRKEKENGKDHICNGNDG